MSNIYYRYLNLFYPFFDEAEVTKKYSSMPDFDPNKNGQWRIEGINPDIFNGEAYGWLNQFDCHAGIAEIFYTAPHSKINYHVDYSGTSSVFDYVKLNFVWGPKKHHYMKWGEPKFGVSNEVGYNSCGSPHILYTMDEIDEKESVCITQPILVNVGRPHIAINDSDIGRWCLCLIPKRNSNGFRIEFTESLELFKDYIS